MKNIISILSAFLFLLPATATLQAQTVLPYFSGFDNATQKNGWQIIRKGATGTYIWNYSTVEPYSGTDCLYHDYPVGGTTVTDDWFVSPPFILTAGGKLDSLRHSFSGFGTPANGDTLAIYLLAGNPDPALATSKTLLYDYRGANYNNDNTWHLTSNLTLPSTPGTSYIAIRYKTINNWLTVKFDNVRLRGNTTTGIGNPGNNTSFVKVFPNPAKDVLSIISAENITTLSIADLNGRVLYHKPFSKKVDVSSFEKGMYFITCIAESGKKSSLSFIKD